MNHPDWDFLFCQGVQCIFQSLNYALNYVHYSLVNGRYRGHKLLILSLFHCILLAFKSNHNLTQVIKQETITLIMKSSQWSSCD
jgi:hypothetical protein